jgi:hypothetical protein
MLAKLKTGRRVRFYISALPLEERKYFLLPQQAIFISSVFGDVFHCHLLMQIVGPIEL